ncbi:hypothetical protein ISCGN_012875 [Ixodes scapularis]
MRNRHTSGDGCSIETMPLRSVAHWFPKLYTKCNCLAYDKKQSSCTCFPDWLARDKLNKKKLSTSMQDIKSQGQKVLGALCATTELETNEHAVRVHRADIAFSALAHFSSLTFFHDGFFTYRGPPRKKAHREKLRHNSLRARGIFFSSVLNKNKDVDEH